MRAGRSGERRGEESRWVAGRNLAAAKAVDSRAIGRGGRRRWRRREGGAGGAGGGGKAASGGNFARWGYQREERFNDVYDPNDFDLRIFNE